MDKKLISSLLAVVGLGVAGAAGAHWESDNWGNDHRSIRKNFTYPEECVLVLDQTGAAFGDFCYEASGVMHIVEVKNKTVTRFQGGGTAKLYAPGTHAAGVPGGTELGTTFFTLKNRAVSNKDDVIKHFRMSFDSDPFSTTAGVCYSVSVEMKFVGYNQIGGTTEDPIFDIVREDTTDIVAAPCGN